MTTYRQYGSWHSVTGIPTLDGEVEDALRTWDENVTDAQVQAVADAYRAAINAVLPDGAMLCGNEFFGPAEGSSADFDALIDGIDFWELAEPLLDT